MIHYQLRCGDGHAFEGWFRDSTAFEDQAERGLLSCPNCGATGIERGLMAPSVRKSRRKTQPGEAGSGEAAVLPVSARAVAPDSAREASPDTARAMLPDSARAMLQRLRADIERHCDDVGDGFAEAARRLHDQGPGERAAGRGIYGRTSETEREALAEEGIEVARIPWLPRADG